MSGEDEGESDAICYIKSSLDQMVQKNVKEVIIPHKNKKGYTKIQYEIVSSV